jgi:hypothetical protein
MSRLVFYSRLRARRRTEAGVLELIQQTSGEEELPTSQEPFAGFTRLDEGTAAA